MQRKISLVVMAIMLFLMAAANSQAEETREPPKLLWFNNLETEKLWAEMIIFSQYSEFMRAKNQFFIKGKMTAEEFAAELDREWAAAIHGASDKDIWIEEYDDE